MHQCSEWPKKGHSIKLICTNQRLTQVDATFHLLACPQCHQAQITTSAQRSQRSLRQKQFKCLACGVELVRAVVPLSAMLQQAGTRNLNNQRQVKFSKAVFLQHSGLELIYTNKNKLKPILSWPYGLWKLQALSKNSDFASIQNKI